MRLSGAESSASGRLADAPPAAPGSTQLAGRLVSLDSLRGYAIAAMIVIANPGIRDAMPLQMLHAGPEGYTLTDSIYPLFLFAIGTAMVFSSKSRDLRRALRRTVILFALGVALSSLRQGALVISWGVLQRIAVAYLLATLLLRLSARARAGAVAAIVAVSMLLFAAWPPTDPQWALWGAGARLLSLWDGNIRLSFSLLSTLGTLLSVVLVSAGAYAGRLLKKRGDDLRVLWPLGGWALGCVAFGLALWPLVPVSQQFWSPTFTVLSLGTAFAYTAAFHALTRPSWSRVIWWPLGVLGTNAIVVYVASFGLRDLVLQDHLRPMVVPTLLELGGQRFAALAYAFGIGLAWWLFCYVLYRRRIFIRV